MKKIVSIVFIVTSFTWACNQGGSAEQENKGNDQSPKEEQVKLPVHQEAPPGESDKHGRKPGDEHYGHDHPPQDQQLDNQTKIQQDAQSGEVDKFGRKPGEEHYGHDHQ